MRRAWRAGGAPDAATVRLTVATFCFVIRAERIATLPRIILIGVGLACAVTMPVLDRDSKLEGIKGARVAVERKRTLRRR